MSFSRNHGDHRDTIRRGAGHLKNELADFAVPKFIRIKNELEQTPTMKFKKDQLKKDGYDIEKSASLFMSCYPMNRDMCH